jgi:hypothetical protein
MRKLALVLLLALGPVAVAAAVALGSNDSPRSDLHRAMKATEKYRSVEAAVADGYVRVSPCESSATGAMGIHYANFALMGNPALDVDRPEILLYEPTSRGKVRLVGVEYWRADADQDLATSFDRPSLFGTDLAGPMPGHSPTMPIHYDLHVWLFRSNPLGELTQYNPKVSCAG